MPVLYLVGTPIGNLEDITLRAIRVLKEVGLIAAEDTRKARVLLSRYAIQTPVRSYHEQGARSQAQALMRLLADKDVALISEAGMPSISDPGYGLVRAAIDAGYRVETVPGPSALTAALAVSGLPTDQFVFLGFLPRGASQRRRLLASVAEERRTLVAFEAPHRLTASLADIQAAVGNRPLAVCRELTKRFEEVFRGTAGEALDHFQQPRGEFVLVIAGYAGPPRQASDEEVLARLRELRDAGATGRDAVAGAVTESGRPRNEVYRLWMKLKRNGEAG